MNDFQKRSAGVFLMALSGLALACPTLATLLFMGVDWLGPISMGDVSFRTYGNVHGSGTGQEVILIGGYLLFFLTLLVVGFLISRRGRSQP